MELQECPEAITSLKYFCEEMNGLALCCAGSLIGISFSVHSFPVGKIDILNMYPMNFEEFLASGIADLFSWHGRESEIEFLKIFNGKVVPIEVKSGKTVHSRSLSAFSEKYSPELKIKVTARNLDQSNPGCYNYPLYLSGKLGASWSAGPQ